MLAAQTRLPTSNLFAPVELYDSSFVSGVQHQ